MTKVFVTGAEGFIGSHLVEELVRRGYSVRALVLYNSFDSRGWLDTLPADVLDSVEIVTGDVRDAFGIRALMKGCDAVLHLAAPADVADVVVRVMVAEVWEALNVASGREVTLVDLAESAVEVVGRGSVLRAASDVEARAGRPQFQLDTTRARGLLGFQASISLRSGLRALHAGEIITA